MTLRIFPVLGGANYSSDFNVVAREGVRSHLGNDLFSAERTPLLAVDDGIIRFGNDPLGGQVANLYSPDGTRYYYAHLFAFEGITNRPVRAADVIGYLGKTGNAANTSPHVHFEVHPNNGTAVDPYPRLRVSTIFHPPPISATGQTLQALFPLAILGTLGVGLWLWSRNPVSESRLVARDVGWR